MFSEPYSNSRRRKTTHICNTNFCIKFALMIHSCTYTGLKPQKCSGYDKFWPLSNLNMYYCVHAEYRASVIYAISFVGMCIESTIIIFTWERNPMSVMCAVTVSWNIQNWIPVFLYIQVGNFIAVKCAVGSMVGLNISSVILGHIREKNTVSIMYAMKRYTHRRKTIRV
jgi:hypothetical protein